MAWGPFCISTGNIACVSLAWDPGTRKCFEEGCCSCGFSKTKKTPGQLRLWNLCAQDSLSLFWGWPSMCGGCFRFWQTMENLYVKKKKKTILGKTRTEAKNRNPCLLSFVLLSHCSCPPRTPTPGQEDLTRSSQSWFVGRTCAGPPVFLCSPGLGPSPSSRGENPQWPSISHPGVGGFQRSCQRSVLTLTKHKRDDGRQETYWLGCSRYVRNIDFYFTVVVRSIRHRRTIRAHRCCSFLWFILWVGLKHPPDPKV